MTSDTTKPIGFDLTGLDIVVVGAAQGIGWAVAEVCASQGANLALVDLDAPAGIARRLESRYEHKVRDFACDISDRAAVSRLAEALDAEGMAPDGLAMVAGITRYRDWIKTPADEWEADMETIVDVNLRGPINLARAFLPGMRQRKWGRVVMVGSIAGHMGGVTSQPHYVASKGGVHALIRLFALQCAGDGVMVNGVAPGPTRTSMTENRDLDVTKFPIQRILEPEEVAWPISFLLSPASAGMVGAIVDVNGGIYFA